MDKFKFELAALAPAVSCRAAAFPPGWPAGWPVCSVTLAPGPATGNPRGQIGTKTQNSAAARRLTERKSLQAKRVPPLALSVSVSVSLASLGLKTFRFAPPPVSALNNNNNNNKRHQVQLTPLSSASSCRPDASLLLAASARRRPNQNSRLQRRIGSLAACFPPPLDCRQLAELLKRHN